MSQSPQTGQFNSYESMTGSNKMADIKVSIPSNGSIQFLREKNEGQYFYCIVCLNPLKRVNSILTELSSLPELTELRVSIPSNGSIQFLP